MHFFGKKHMKKCTSSRKMDSCFPVVNFAPFSGKMRKGGKYEESNHKTPFHPRFCTYCKCVVDKWNRALNRVHFSLKGCVISHSSHLSFMQAPREKIALSPMFRPHLMQLDEVMLVNLQLCLENLMSKTTVLASTS